MLNMTATCAHCPKPVASRGMTCDSCLGEAHRPRPKRRAKALRDMGDNAAFAGTVPMVPPPMPKPSIVVGVDGVPTEIECEDPRALPIVEPPVYTSRPPVDGRDASGANANGGLKYSAGKPRFALLPVGPLTEMAKVVTFGAVKYTKNGVPGDNNWQKNSASDYVESMLRHIYRWQSGETADDESGLHPLAHACVDGMFTLWFCLRDGK